MFEYFFLGRVWLGIMSWLIWVDLLLDVVRLIIYLIGSVVVGMLLSGMCLVCLVFLLFGLMFCVVGIVFFVFVWCCCLVVCIVKFSGLGMF